MFKRNHLTLIAAALALGFGTQAFADDVDADESADSGMPGVEIDRAPGDRAGIPGVDVDLTTRVGGLDRDNDQLISRSEAASDAEFKAQFAALDKDHDGKLSNSEYTQFRSSKSNVSVKDRDDGGVPGIDVDRVPGDRVGMPGIDVDITARLGKLDTDGDRSISRAEATDAKLKADFGKLDTNKDGKLDSAEFARFEAIDTK
ncbi:MAG TPA: hypothetical protein VM074_09720 [Solimonas sp.]|nr:hypothetical protein [Solimonas sp.]